MQVFLRNVQLMLDVFSRYTRARVLNSSSPTLIYEFLRSWSLVCARVTVERNNIEGSHRRYLEGSRLGIPISLNRQRLLRAALWFFFFFFQRIRQAFVSNTRDRRSRTLIFFFTRTRTREKSVVSLLVASSREKRGALSEKSAVAPRQTLRRVATTLRHVPTYAILSWQRVLRSYVP